MLGDQLQAVANAVIDLTDQDVFGAQRGVPLAQIPA